MSIGGTATFSVSRGEVGGFGVQGQRTLTAGWHHVVGTVDPATNVILLYVDGVLDGIGISDSPIVPNDFLRLGVHSPSTLLDDIAVYSSVLTATQIANHYYQQSIAHGGPGAVMYAVAANASIDPRTGVVHAAGSDITITQAGHPCFSVTPASITVGASGGTGAITVTALDSSCAWTATSDHTWATLDTSSGSGTQTVHYAIDASTLPINRSATLVVAGQTIAILETAAPVTRPGLRYSLAIGKDHVLALKNDGSVWSWGRNHTGQLGVTGGSFDRGVAYPVSGISNVVAVAAGASHSLALDSSGHVWGWGANNAGQLGDGTQNSYSVPTQNAILSNVVAIAAGDNHSAAITADGAVWTWGYNQFGELGDGTQTTRLSPVHVTLSSPAAAIAAYADRTLVLDATGAVWVFGFGWGTTPTTVSLPPNTIGSIGLSASDGFAVALDGTVWGWGTNFRGQLGDGTTTSPPELTAIALPATTTAVQIVGGGTHTIALQGDGTIRAWGDNVSGQLGNGIAPCVPGDFTCATNQFSKTPVQTVGPTTIVAIAAQGDTAQPSQLTAACGRGAATTIFSSEMAPSPPQCLLSRSPTQRLRGIRVPRSWIRATSASERFSRTWRQPAPMRSSTTRWTARFSNT